EAARGEERERREAWRRAQHAITAARAGLDRAESAIGDLAIKRSTLEEARTHLGAALAEANAMHAEARQLLAEAGDEAETAAAASAAQARLDERRDAAEQARLKLGTLETAAAMRRTRLAQLERDNAAWRRRREGAEAQLATLGQRRAEVEKQLAGLSEAPEGFADRKAQLEAQIEQAQAEHKAAGDHLNAAQTHWREAERAAKAANDALNAVRIEVTRIEERLKGIIAQRQQIERQTEESLGIPASRTLEASGIRPEQALPDEHAVEQRLDRLKAERERLGGVNLSAEKEAEEVQEKRDTMVADRDDLIEAIAKLRSGIAALNREGRLRLNEA